MSRLRFVARHEWRSAWRDRTLPTVIGVFVVFLGLATWTSVSLAQARLKDERATIREATDAIDARKRTIEAADKTGAQPYGEVRRMNGIRQQPVLATGPQAFLATGTSDTHPQRASFLPLVNRWTIFDDARADFENPDVTASGRIDPAAVIVFLLPLLLLAVTCDAWVVEREQGTEALLRSQPVSPRVVWMGKALVHAVVPVACAASVVGVVTLAGTRTLTGDWIGAWSGACWAAALTIGYGAVWAALGLFLSARASSSERAIGAGGLAWVAGVLVVPSLAAVIVDVRVPVPSFGERVNTVRLASATADAEGGTIRRTRTGQLPLDAPVEARMARLWANGRGRLAEVGAGERAAAPVAEAYAADMHRRIVWADRLRWLSPASIALDGFERLAGTDAERALLFQDEALRLHASMRALSEDFAQREHYMTRADYDRLPVWRSPPVRRAPVMVHLIVLGMLVAALVFRTQWHRTRSTRQAGASHAR